MANAESTAVPEAQRRRDGLLPVLEGERVFGLTSYVLMWWASLIVIQVFVLGANMMPPAGGLNIFQAIVVMSVAAVVVVAFFCINGTPGLKYGIPFAVQCRSAFGTRGAKIPEVLRIIPAIAWYGIGSWIGALSVNAVASTIFGLGDYTAVYFVLFTVIQTVIAWYGIKSIKTFDASMSVIIFLLMAYFLFVVFRQEEVALREAWFAAGSWGLPFWTALTAAIGILATVMLNISDLTRHLTPATQSTNFLGHLFGVVPPWVFIFIMGVVTATVAGQGDPVAALMQVAPSVGIGIALLVFIILAQITTNLTINILPPTMVFQDILNVTWKQGTVVTGILSVITFPWILLKSQWFFTFINFYAAFLGPILGIMLSDYWVTRRRRLSVDDLYVEREGSYWFRRGFSPAAFVTLVVASAVSLIFVDVSWLVGMPLAFVLHIVLVRLGLDRVKESAPADRAMEAKRAGGEAS
jgi:nucleobase:cation symporter-1, NCS1 family